MNLKSRFVYYLNKKYSSLDTSLLEPLISDQLLSPFQITLSLEQIQNIKSEIKAYWGLRNWGEQKLVSQYSELNLRKPHNYSACMSYDFHINPEGRPELIEINTNASFLALGLELYAFLGFPNPAGNFGESDLVEMFKNEIRLCGGNESSIAVIDENPETQKLYAEFLIYRQLFKNRGIQSEIFDITDVDNFKKYSLIYNRYTDFYLQDPKSLKIKDLFNAGLMNLSPNPYEYFLLADKQRLLDWNSQTEIPKPESLLKIYDMGTEDKDTIWSLRKNLFFKPKNSFGGKQAYKGASISRKFFEEVSSANFVAQQLSTPAQVTVDYENNKLEFKYDLRCFAYKDQLQLVVARLYQGQTTNLKTPGGGFACITVS